MSLLVRHWWGWVRHIQRPIAGALAPYLDRYTLRKQGDSGTNPWRVYLHHFLARDSDDFHNHPSKWGFSVVLWGSYTEEVLEPDHKCTWHQRNPTLLEGYPDYDFCMEGSCREFVVRARKVRWFNWIPASKYHRITHLHPGPGARGVWTVFVCGPLTGRGWGFYVPGQGHVDHSAKEHTKVTEK